LSAALANIEHFLLTNITNASDCQTPSGQIPGNQPEEGVDG